MRALAFIFILFFVGVYIGLQSADPPVVNHTKTITVVKHDTKTVTVHDAVMSEACKTAVRLGEKFGRQSETIDTNADKQVQLFSEIKVAIFENDTSALSALETKQRNISETYIGTVTSRGVDLPVFQRAMKACAKEVQ